MYVVSIEGIAVAVPITKEELQRWLRSYPSALEVFAKLGIVAETGPEIVAAVPTFPCKGCGNARPIHELFGGECRRCAGLEARQA